MRRWLEVADAAGLGAELTEVLERARILVRGPKARGAVRAAGLEDSGMSVDERTPGDIGLDFDLTELSFGIFGFLLVIMMVLRPQGLIPEKRHQAEFAEVLEGEPDAPIMETRE